MPGCGGVGEASGTADQLDGGRVVAGQDHRRKNPGDPGAAHLLERAADAQGEHMPVELPAIVRKTGRALGCFYKLAAGARLASPLLAGGAAFPPAADSRAFGHGGCPLPLLESCRGRRKTGILGGQRRRGNGRLAWLAGLGPELPDDYFMVNDSFVIIKLPVMEI